MAGASESMNPASAASSPASDRQTGSMTLAAARVAAQVSFQQYVATSARRRYLVAGLFIPIGIPLFGLTDWLLYPDQLAKLLSIRAAIAVVGIITLIVTYFARSYWPVVLASAAGSAVTSCGVSLIGYVAEGYASPYFAGVGLILAGTACFMEWPDWLTVTVVSSVIAFHLAPAVLFGLPANVPRFIFESGLIFTFGMICIAALHVRIGLARQDYEAKRALGRSYLMLEEVNRTKDQLFQNISHEFRTPLALILAPIESLLEKAPAAGPERQKLGSVRDNALRLLNLINDLLDLAKLDAVGLKADLQRVELGSFVRGIAEQAGFLAERQGLTFQVIAGEQPLHFMLDPKFLEKIVLNLLSNAFKFTPAGGAVTLEVADSSEGLSLRVRDTGAGIPPAALQSIFERFRQVDGTSTRHRGGTGIGLALVQELTVVMSGTVQVESELGKGTTFTLRFPPALRTEAISITREPVQEEPPVESSMSGLSRRAAFTVLVNKEGADDVLRGGAQGPLVLVAEDDPELRRNLVELLAGKYRVTAVPNGRVALEMATISPPDLILSDVMMPEMDGLTLTTRVRQHPGLRETPIVLLSARADLEDRVAGRQLGVDTYLTKPYEPKEVIATIEGLLRSRMRLVGEYMLRELIGSGAQSQVYRAQHRATSEVVALKLLNRDALGTEDRERLRREGAVLQKLHHPNIVTVLGQGFDDTHGYLVMELLEGRSLTELVKAHGFIPHGVAVAIATALADALIAVHAAGILHRDIKGDNVVLLGGAARLNDRVKLIDFGVVRDAQLKTLSEEKTLVGTLPFLAPELLHGAEPSAATDLYALGVLLFWMCAGELPFRGTSRTTTFTAILTERAPRLASKNPAVPAALDELVATALGPPEGRFATAARLREALRNLKVAAETWDAGERTENVSQTTGVIPLRAGDATG